MAASYLYQAIYLIPIVLIVLIYGRSKVKFQKKSSAAWQEAVESGLTEPPTLHPVVDLAKCFGSGACVKACPEHAIGIIDGKATLVNPAHCIGHGACEPVCPTKAIRLVFGTEKRGMEIPKVQPNFETNISGIFIAGELGGMGLIRKAVSQGQKAIESIAMRPRGKFDYDVVIVGAGPAGISASLAAQKTGLKYVTIDQEDSLGGTTYHYPRNKIVMTAPMNLPLFGDVKVKEISKEALMELWTKVSKKLSAPVRYSERMEDIKKDGDGFVVVTPKGSYRTGSVLLAIGRRGVPRKLGAPGEEQSKVVYRLIEPEQYRGKEVVVVGGGDSALEAALDIAAEKGTTVALSYRGAAFNRVKIKNRTRLDEAVAANKIFVLLESQILDIGRDNLKIRCGDDDFDLPNDSLIVCAGGELPTPFLKKIGVMVDMHRGE